MRKLVVLIAFVGAYLVWPYAALYRIGSALQRGDVAAVTSAIDWDAVREGLKEDIADDITGQPGSATASVTDALPPFGVSFVKGMAGNMVDQTVTPEHLAQTVHALHEAGTTGTAPMLKSAWLTGPAQFEARFLLPDEEVGAAPVRVEMDLVPTGWGFSWRITRAWIPSAVLEQLETKAS